MYNEIRYSDTDIKKHCREEGETKAAAWIRKYTKAKQHGRTKIPPNLSSWFSEHNFLIIIFCECRLSWFVLYHDSLQLPS